MLLFSFFPEEVCSLNGVFYPCHMFALHSSQRRPLTFVNQTLADAGHTLVSAGAFVFDDDVMAGTQLDKDGVQIQVRYTGLMICVQIMQ